MDLDVHLPAIARGDARAFATWMAVAEGTIRDSLRSFATVVDAEAVLQEALVRVWHVAPRFVPDGRPNGLVRLAVRIARNFAISEVRRTKARPLESEALERAMNAPAETLEPADPLLRRVLAECHAKLPPKPREALAARLESQGARPDDELAARLGMRLNTFLQNFTRARQLLAECLSRRGIAIDEGLRS